MSLFNTTRTPERVQADRRLDDDIAEGDRLRPHAKSGGSVWLAAVLVIGAVWAITWGVGVVRDGHHHINPVSIVVWVFFLGILPGFLVKVVALFVIPKRNAS